MIQKNFPLLRRLIEITPDVEVRDNEGKTPLFIAVTETKDPELVQFLLSFSMNPLIEKKDGMSLLQAAIESDNSQQMRSIFTQLYLAGNKAESAHEIHKTLHESICKGNFSSFFQALQKGAAIENCTQPVLHTAVRKNQLPMLVFLLNWFQVDIEETDTEGNTPYDLALQSMQQEMISLLLTHGAVASSKRFKDAYQMNNRSLFTLLQKHATHKPFSSSSSPLDIFPF